MPNFPQLVIGFYAVWRAGCVADHVSADGLLPDERYIDIVPVHRVSRRLRCPPRFDVPQVPLGEVTRSQ
jgi:hypothetical protein